MLMSFDLKMFLRVSEIIFGFWSLYSGFVQQCALWLSNRFAVTFIAFYMLRASNDTPVCTFSAKRSVLFIFIWKMMNFRQNLPVFAISFQNGEQIKRDIWNLSLRPLRAFNYAQHGTILVYFFNSCGVQVGSINKISAQKSRARNG